MKSIFRSQNANLAYVEFEAIFVDGNHLKSIHENSEFIFDNGRWYYTKGTHLPNIHNEEIISRSKPCPCGSRRKFKNCHGA